MNRFLNISITLAGIVLLSTLAFPVLAQRPDIQSVSQLKGSVGHVLTIKGSNFGTDKTKLTVTFGADTGYVQFASDQLLHVKIPAGTTYQDISVTRKVTAPQPMGFTGYYRMPFMLSFGGSHPFDAVANLGAQQNFPNTVPSGDGLYDLCACDFNRDNKPDIAVTKNGLGKTFLNVFTNGSTPGTIAMPSQTSTSLGGLQLQIKCGDLNGDGYADVIATEKGNPYRIFILENSGVASPMFNAMPAITVAGQYPNKVEIADLDLDGLPELILTSQAKNNIVVLRNTTTQNATIKNISFSTTPIVITVPGLQYTDGLAVEDLNGDFLPEIITADFLSSSDIHVIQNKSTPGNINMTVATKIPVGLPVKNMRIGDLDGDGKSDIAFTRFTDMVGGIGIVLNSSAGNTFSFGSIQYISTQAYPWGLDFGDLDGDGKADIVATFVTQVGASPAINILNNESTPGIVSFQVLKRDVTYVNRHVVVTDLDVDGKPDIAITSVESPTVNKSCVSVFRNEHCMEPKITPEGPLNVCSGNPVVLESTQGRGVSYLWSDGTTTTSKFTPTTTGTYAVTVTSEGGACIKTSNAVNVTVQVAPAVNPVPTNNGPVCENGSIQFSVNDESASGYTYKWTGPNGYTGTGVTPPTIPSSQLANSGLYQVTATHSSNCVGKVATTLVEVEDLPDFKVAYTGSPIICSGLFKVVNASPNLSSFTYQWYETATGIKPAGASLTVAAGGEYYYVASSTKVAGCTAPSEKVKFTTPVDVFPDFNYPFSACTGQEVAFTNESTGDPTLPLEYGWAFGDGQSSTDKDPKHTYSTAGPFNIILTASYASNTCPKQVTKTITITAAPAVSITNPDNTFSLCPAASLDLGVNGTFTTYKWNTGATTPTITVTEPGEYSVNVTNTTGCALKAAKAIIGLLTPEVVATATPDLVNEGEQAQLNAEGINSYAWSPAETLSDATIANPTATPLTSTTYTVTGLGANGCEGTATVEVKVKGDAIVTKLKPSNFFSPNGDAVSPVWTVGKIEEYPQCEITIYDDKGVKVFNARPYENNWDGTFNGKRLPDGVYYYIIRCEGEEGMPRSGSITILR